MPPVNPYINIKDDGDVQVVISPGIVIPAYVSKLSESFKTFFCQGKALSESPSEVVFEMAIKELHTYIKTSPNFLVSILTCIVFLLFFIRAPLNK